MYKIFLDIRPGQKIVDVGCGPGDFTRYLGKLSQGKARILGIDSNPKSIKAAIEDTKKAHLSHSITYKVGDVYNLPVGENYADLTCCRTLLMHLTDKVRAVKEMARITKPGGSVAAVEQGDLWSYYDPNDEKFSQLEYEVYDAWLKGVRKLEGKDFAVGEKLPDIFQKAGLTMIKAEVQTDTYLTSDPRLSLNDTKAQLRFSLTRFKERMDKDSKYAVAAGFSKRKATEYNRKYVSKIERLLSDDTLLRTDPTFSTNGIFIVSGMKNKT